MCQNCANERNRPMPDQLSREQFTDALHDGLQHYYEYAALRANPAVRYLATGAEVDEVEQFREIVSAAIERLRPIGPFNAAARSARTYQILRLRYIEQRDVADILYRIALSKRQFYRDNAKAIGALADLLYRSTHEGTPKSPEISASVEITRLSENAQPATLELNDLLVKVKHAVEPLAAQRGLTLLLEGADSLAILVRADRVLLRQALLSVLSSLVMRGMEGDAVHFTAAVGNSISVSFRVVSANGPAIRWSAEAPELVSLLYALDADLTRTEDAITLSLPIDQETVLIVDDNPDVHELFRQYLHEQPYRMLSAHDGAQAIRIARDMIPDVIVLDVMLPGEDGLDLLQNLKHHPRTASIPVLVCSVLTMPDLALSLGADGYLHKPPGREDFIRALERRRE